MTSPRYHLTDYALFPHLQYFNSAAELLQGLWAAKLPEIHRDMAAFNAATWRSSSKFYRAAVAALLRREGNTQSFVAIEEICGERGERLGHEVVF